MRRPAMFRDSSNVARASLPAAGVPCPRAIVLFLMGRQAGAVPARRCSITPGRRLSRSSSRTPLFPVPALA